jgi:hypothetical protein
MHLLLGHPEDPCCASVRSLLEAGGYATRVIANPLEYPFRFAWRLSSEQSVGQLAWDGELPISSEHIAGVLVRSSGWINTSGWEADDLAYVRAETQAALLAWLWSLPCPVVNRYPAALWYRPQVPLLAWQPLLRRCGLPTVETLVTNVELEARDFGSRFAQEGVAGTVYGPLTGDQRYLVSDDEDWSGLAALQRTMPVCLFDPHGPAQLACVVGEWVVWEGEPSPAAVDLEPPLRRFAAAAGLACVELALASSSESLSVIAVDPQINFDHFGMAARQRVVEKIVQLLTAEAG